MAIKGDVGRVCERTLRVVDYEGRESVRCTAVGLRAWEGDDS